LLALDIVHGHILHRYRRAIHPHDRQHSLASFHCGNSSCTWFYTNTMAALVGLQSLCQIDMRCAHRLWAQARSLRTGSRPFIGRQNRLAQGVYTLAKSCRAPNQAFKGKGFTRVYPRLHAPGVPRRDQGATARSGGAVRHEIRRTALSPRNHGSFATKIENRKAERQLFSILVVQGVRG